MTALRGQNGAHRVTRGHQRLCLWELMLLVAGAGVGLGLFADMFGDDSEPDLASAVFVIEAVLGGLSLIGPPLLLVELRRRRHRWGPGKVLWFAQGLASWLLWPPIVYVRLRGKESNEATASICFMYGTPLMAIYVTCALLAGGWLRRRGGRLARRRSWREQFGLLLAAAWACTGFYILYTIYGEDFGR